jgi:hypothetical protein
MRNDYKSELRTVGLRRNGVTIVAAPTTFTGVDTQGYRSCLFICHVDFSVAGKSMTLQVQDSDDNSNWNLTGPSYTFTGSEALTACSALVDAAKYRRYVRLSVTAYVDSVAPSCVAVLFNENITPDALANVDSAVL